MVIKIGTRLLTGGGFDLRPERVAAFADAVARHPETETVVVTSGAVAAGCGVLGLARRPGSIPERQAAAAVGQAHLMGIWTESFAARGRTAGQVLLTADGLRDRRRWLHARNTLEAMRQAAIVPVVNENDTISVEEIRVGDNDNLAAYVAALVDADVLALLTDVDGVYDADPRRDPEASVVARAETADELRGYCFARSAKESIGGMETKLQAAEKAASYGIPTVIANGLDANVLDGVFAGRPVGTWVEGRPNPLPARKHWMAIQTRLPGRVVVDEGAAAALAAGGASLLARGILNVVGRFEAGDVIAIVDRGGAELARALPSYDSAEIVRIMGRHSDEIEGILGYVSGREVVRGDDMVLMRSA